MYQPLQFADDFNGIHKKYFTTQIEYIEEKQACADMKRRLMRQQLAINENALTRTEANNVLTDLKIERAKLQIMVLKQQHRR